MIQPYMTFFETSWSQNITCEGERSVHLDGTPSDLEGLQ